VQEIKDIIKLLDVSIKEDCENTLTSGNIIKDNYDKKVDEYRWLVNNSKDWLADYQSKLILDTKISWLKIKFTWVSWYFIEVTKSNLKNIPDYFTHKQTLVNASRFITLELKEFEKKLLNAQSILNQREYDIFLDIRLEILSKFNKIKNFSKKTSYIDFCSWLWLTAYKNWYSRPIITTKYDLDIKWGRHPIIENIEKDFISNDLLFNKSNYINIITWPNMWWKSTFLRQNALIILMSHIWSFVPAKNATIPLTDKIFSRVWATDNLFFGQSTFMVEMQEMANILNNSTKNSFVIIDEIGRWTSTYDWMSLAWAILKYIHDNIKSKTLFATHYHELIDESKELSWVNNFSVSVWENNWTLVFLRKIVQGWIKKSFWLEVASLAWININIIKEAKKMLKELEKEHNIIKSPQLSLWSITVEPEIEYIKEKSIVEEELKKIDIDSLTPIEALNKLSELKSNI